MVNVRSREAALPHVGQHTTYPLTWLHSEGIVGFTEHWKCSLGFRRMFDIMEATLRTWTNDIDPTTIPDDVLKSERARRNNLLRRTHSGGSVWGTHNPDTKRCRCERCNQKRERRRERAALQPKRPRGRPRVHP